MNPSIEIIAEGAQGYEGRFELARLLVRGAAKAKADAIKFQLVYANEITTPGHMHYGIHKSLEMPFRRWASLAEQAREEGLRFYLDIFGERSLREAKKLAVDGVKIHTTDFLNHRLVARALERFSRVFIAFGGVSLAELEKFVARHRLQEHPGVTMLYGFQSEPTPIERNNLLRLPSLFRAFPGIAFGFMDHESGESPFAATLSLVALATGIRAIEKHITLDRILAIEDFISALPCDRFQAFVESVRWHSLALGSSSLAVDSLEKQYRNKAAKVVVAARDLKAGDILTEQNTRFTRADHPADDTCYFDTEQALGRQIIRPVKKFGAIRQNHFKKGSSPVQSPS